MEQIVKLLQELIRQVFRLFRSLLMIVLLAASLIIVAIYRMAIWVDDNPGVWLLAPATFLTVWTFRRYVFGRLVEVERDDVVIVQRWGGRLEPLYLGRHRLKIGERVRQRLSLKPLVVRANMEEVYTLDEERVRLLAGYELYLSDPLHFYLSGRRRAVDFDHLNRWGLLVVLEDFGYDDLYNFPFEINGLVSQTINQEVREFGLQVINYRLEEAIWPASNQRWKRNRVQPALPPGDYWVEGKSLTRR